jgi:hypothetical protein
MSNSQYNCRQKEEHAWIEPTLGQGLTDPGGFQCSQVWKFCWVARRCR